MGKDKIITSREKAKIALEKTIKKINQDPTLILNLPFGYSTKTGDKAFTVENLETITANHLFDDNPNAFGITESEAYDIRGYFSKGAQTYDFILELKDWFPYFFKVPENDEYIEGANERRKEKGLSPICL